MIKLIHSIQINVFEKDENNLEKINQIFQSLLPVDFIKEKIEVNHEKLEGFNQNIIHSLTLRTSKDKHNTLLSDTIFSNMNINDVDKIYNEIESRLNEEGYFYLRFDKDKFMKQIYQLTESGDCFHIKFKMAGFPAKRSAFIESINAMLNKYKK